MDYSKNSKQYWRKIIKHRSIEALGGKCIICGNTFDDCCYDFHHIDSSQKDFAISSINTNGARTWLQIRDELRKCALLCANCHRKYHNGLVNFDTTKNYFNDAFYDWDWCNARAFNINKGIPLNTSNTKCPLCNKEKSPRSNLCADCAQIHKHKFEIGRDELKELIYNLPFAQIGKMFGVSDKAICKRCISYGLPYRKTDIKNYSKEEWDKI